jgi:ribosome-binding factor A
MSIRAEKVASVIKKAIIEPITALGRERSAGFITVSSVKLSRDLRIAKIYISILGAKSSPGIFIKALEDNQGKIRAHIGRNVRMRFLPELRFYLDDTLDQMEHIQDVIDSVKTDEEIEFNKDDYNEKHLPE